MIAHRSRLAGFIIGCRHARLDEAAGFWAEALGATVVARPAHARRVVMQAPTGQRYGGVRWLDDATRNDANLWL